MTKYTMLLSSAVALLACGVAHAQDTTADADSQSGAVSGSNAVVAFSSNIPSQQSIETVGFTDTPGLTAGMNACVGSVSVGGGFMGGSFAGGRTYTDEGCELRNLAGLTADMGDIETAFALLCLDEQFQAARMAVGRPCAAISEQATQTQPTRYASAAEAERAAPRRPRKGILYALGLRK